MTEIKFTGYKQAANKDLKFNMLRGVKCPIGRWVKTDNANAIAKARTHGDFEVKDED